MIKSKKQMYIIIGVFLLIVLLCSTTYAFFNYTRTGAGNTIRVGKIAFLSNQTNGINLPNVFPIDPNPTNLADNTKVGIATIDISGDTTYSNGVEYLISAVNVNNTVGTGANAKTVPISIAVSYAEKTNKDIGTESENYFSLRGGDTSYYRVLSNATIAEDDKLLVGYIASGADGIDGTITITAYLDKNRIGISDTYDGTESDNMGTNNSWARGKTILTTTEWNSLQTNGISFKLKVEANEGTWVEDTTDSGFEISGTNFITLFKNGDTTSRYEIIRYDGNENSGDTVNLFLSTNDDSVSMSDGIITIDEDTTLDSIEVGATVNDRTIYKTIPLLKPADLPDNLVATDNVIQNEIAGQNSGTISSNNSYVRTDYLEVDENKTLFLNSDTAWSVYIIMAFYDENHQFISGLQDNNRTNLSVYSINGILVYGKTINIPSTAKYMIISESKDQNNGGILNYYYVNSSNISQYEMTLDYNSAITLSGLKIAHFGDSIFGNYASPNDIPSYISTYFGSTNYNIGVGGTRMAQHSTPKYDAFSMYNLAHSINTNDFTLQENNITLLNNANYTNNFNTLKSLDFNNLDYITIAFGTNDLTTGALYTTTNPIDTSKFEGALRYSIEQIRETYPNLKIILIPPIYRFFDERNDSSNRIQSTKYFTEYVNVVKKVALEFDNIYVFDGLSELDINSTNRYVYFTTRDNTHPNANGIKLYAYKLGKFIENLEHN